MSAALGIENKLMGAAGSKYSLQLNPELPPCIGEAHCIATVSGQLPASFVPPLTNRYPLIQTVRITEPANYARTVFIAALQAAGVSVNAATVARNPTQLLPPKNSYAKDSKIAELKGMPYGDYAKFILKVSYNIGADTSLVLLGLTHNLDNMTDALAFERQNLITKHGIPEDSFHFVDGSGGGSTTATNEAVTKMLADMKASPVSSIFMDCLPSLGVDGSLGFVKDFQSDATLSGATGQVHAKTGTYLEGTDSGLVLKGQAFGGYITTKAGKHLIYQLVVNNVKVTGLDDLLKVFQDQGVISAILWRDN
jgi:D-alanyl-D-alanine carboxypeptidase